MKLNERELPYCEKIFGEKIHEISSTVNRYFDHIPNEGRHGTDVLVRHVTQYFCTILTESPIWYIGYKTGGFDHSLINYSVKKIRRKANSKTVFASHIEELERRLRNKAPLSLFTNNQFIVNRFLKVC